jgi:hypothetical protein
MLFSIWLLAAGMVGSFFLGLFGLNTDDDCPFYYENTMADDANVALFGQGPRSVMYQ